MDAVEEIKERLDTSEVVGSYVQLKPAGANHKGLCPFHNEKSPSFMVSDEKGIWHCFGCGEGGDIFTFVEKIEGLDFKGALEQLAAKAGVELPERGGDKGAAKLKERLFSATELATKYFQTGLVKSKAAQDYVIKQRGFNRQVVTDFRIGFAPNSDSGLSDLLRKKGYKNQEIIKAGLARNRSGKLQDLFRGRLMIPFMDTNGRVIGFTGRVLEDGMPKYLNSPATPLFDKSRFVFGLTQAKGAIRKNDGSIVVEGNLDVLTAHQYGFQQVVAVSGTALTAQQLKALSRLSRNVKLAFDADSAGLAATERAIPLAQNAGVTLSIITLLGGKDPDELIRKDKRRWEESVNSASYIMDWLLKVLCQQFDVSTGTGKKQIAERYAQSLARLSDPVEQDHYVSRLAKTVDVNPQSVWRKLEQKQPASHKLQTAHVAPVITAREHEDIQVVERALLALCVLYPDTRVSLDELNPDHFTDEAAKNVASYLPKLGEKSLPANLPKQLQGEANYVKILLLIGEQQYRDWAALDRRIEAFSLAQRLQALYLKKTKQNLQKQIAMAEAAGNEARAKQLLEQYRDLK